MGYQPRTLVDPPRWIHTCGYRKEGIIPLIPLLACSREGKEASRSPGDKYRLPLAKSPEFVSCCEGGRRVVPPSNPSGRSTRATLECAVSWRLIVIRLDDRERLSRRLSSLETQVLAWMEVFPLEERSGCSSPRSA